MLQFEGKGISFNEESVDYIGGLSQESIDLFEEWLSFSRYCNTHTLFMHMHHCITALLSLSVPMPNAYKVTYASEPSTSSLILFSYYKNSQLYESVFIDSTQVCVVCAGNCKGTHIFYFEVYFLIEIKSQENAYL